MPLPMVPAPITATFFILLKVYTNIALLAYLP
jgi:hypothetical protein